MIAYCGWHFGFYLHRGDWFGVGMALAAAIPTGVLFVRQRRS